MRRFFSVLLLLACSFVSVSQSRINIIPKPEKLQEMDGNFPLNNNKILVSKEFREVGLLLADLMQWKQNRVIVLQKGSVPPAGSIVNTTVVPIPLI